MTLQSCSGLGVMNTYKLQAGNYGSGNECPCFLLFVCEEILPGVITH